MDTTPQEEGTYRPVGFGGAFARQFKLLWMSRRPLLLMLGLVGILALAGEPWVDNQMARLLVVWPVWMLFIGPLWAFTVWHNEGPSNRLYFWAHPVARQGHTLARLAAGVAWLWTMYLLLIAVGYIIALFDGNARQFAAISAPGWLSLFTGPLLGYLVISVLTVASDYPIRWFLAILAGVPALLSILIELLGGEALARLLFRPFSESWGLPQAVIAPFAESVVELGRRLAGMPQTTELPFDIGVWWIAMPLWVLFLAGLIFLLARRHPDTFPRLRRG